MDDWKDFADQLFGTTKPEKGAPIRGRVIDGVQYVRADDVAALLEANGVLPRTTKILRGERP